MLPIPFQLTGSGGESREGSCVPYLCIHMSAILDVTFYCKIFVIYAVCTYRSLSTKLSFEGCLGGTIHLLIISDKFAEREESKIKSVCGRVTFSHVQGPSIGLRVAKSDRLWLGH
jgi:hypothetical protein